MKLRNALKPLMVLFVLVNVLGIIFGVRMKAIGLDPDVLMVGNLLVAAITFFSFWMLYRGFQAKTTAGFLSSVYGSFIIKLAIALFVVFVYAKWKGNDMNMPGVFSVMFLYLVYTFLEVKGLLQLMKKD